ncbi:MAG: DNA-processing protein DprA [Oscillospiraceae bacterium]|nr:DNA-processing protein DprA [Oscillospiraceae bacterium]
MAALKYWVWLSCLKGLRPATAVRLCASMGGPEKIYFASREDLLLAGATEKEAERLADRSLAGAAAAMEACAAAGIRILTLADAEYPDRLKNIYDPPPVLYVRGTLPHIDEEAAVAVAGTRKCTPYGLRMAERIGFEMAREGCLTVSGLARGIDTAAVRGALKAGGRTVGVIGSGPDVIYPPENRELFEDVAASGAILSEYPPGTEPAPWHFPARNRILSGLSVGVVIIEAPEKSGALITAARALEQGRDVFALPANADSPFSAGSNRLIRAGAIPILNGSDVADEYRALYPEKLTEHGPYALTPEPPDGSEGSPAGNGQTGDEKRSAEGKIPVDNEKSAEYDKLPRIAAPLPDLSPDERAIYESLTEPEMHVNDLIERTALPGGRVLAALTLLEIRGLIRRCPGQRFERRTE